MKRAERLYGKEFDWNHLFDCGVERKGGVGRVVRVGENYELALVKEEAIVHGRRIDPIGERLCTFNQEIVAIVVEKLNLRLKRNEKQLND